MKYRNRELIDRFLETWDVTRPEANEVFGEFKRFLWMCVKTRTRVAPVPIVDEMWHTFLMYTIEYREFTTRYFGTMYEHIPTRMHFKREFERLVAKAPAHARGALAARLEPEIAIVMDVLGEKTVLRWYVTYQQRYGLDFFKTRRRSSGLDEVRFPDELAQAASR